MRNCNICGKPIVLYPSAQQRAEGCMSGNSAAYYTSLFTAHAECELRKRKEDTAGLMRRLGEEYESRRVVVNTFRVNT